MEINMVPIITHEFAKKQEIYDYIERKAQKDEELKKKLLLAPSDDAFKKIIASNIFKLADIRSMSRARLILAYLGITATEGVKEIIRKFYPKIYRNYSSKKSFCEYIDSVIKTESIELAVAIYSILQKNNKLYEIEAENKRGQEILSAVRRTVKVYLHIQEEGAPKPDERDKQAVKDFKKKESFMMNGKNCFTYPESKEEIPLFCEVDMMLLRHGIMPNEIRYFQSSKADEEAFLVAVAKYTTNELDNLKKLQNINSIPEMLETVSDIFSRHYTNMGSMFFILSKLASLYSDGREYTLKLLEKKANLTWELLDREAKERIEVEEKTKNIREEMERKIKEQEEKIKMLQVENDRLKVSLSDANEKIDMLEELEENIARDGQDEESVSLKEEKEEYPEGTILWGGHERWQKFFIEKHPEIKKVLNGNGVHDDQTLNEKIPLILINAGHMAHASYYKYMPIIKRKNIPYKFLF